MPEALELGSQARAQFVDFAIHAMPEEACALLAGRLVDVEGHGQLARVTSVHLTANVAKHPRANYVIDPRSQFLVERNVKSRGETIVGVIHSHPRGTATLSNADREIARLRREQTGEAIVFVVVSMADKEIRAYVVDDQGGAGEIRIASDQPSRSTTQEEPI